MKDDQRSDVVLNIFFEAECFSLGNKKQPLKLLKNVKETPFHKSELQGYSMRRTWSYFQEKEKVHMRLHL